MEIARLNRPAGALPPLALAALILLALASGRAALAGPPLAGDADNNGTLERNDFNLILDVVLNQGTAPGITDANQDSKTNVGDAIGVLNFVNNPPSTFNFRDYFILSQNSFWDYTDGIATPDTDSFRWTVLSDTIAIPAGGNAIRIKTDAVDTGDDRHLSEDFWLLEGNGDIKFAGFHQGKATSVLLVQDIFMDVPILVGRDNENLGDQIISSSSATFQTTIGSVSGTVNSTIHFTGFLASVNTPAGQFTDVLRMTVDLSAQVSIFSVPISTSTFILKKGVGMIAIDQAPDVNDADLLLLSGGQVAGVPITASR